MIIKLSERNRRTKTKMNVHFIWLASFSNVSKAKWFLNLKFVSLLVFFGKHFRKWFLIWMSLLLLLFLNEFLFCYFNKSVGLLWSLHWKTRIENYLWWNESVGCSVMKCFCFVFWWLRNDKYEIWNTYLFFFYCGEVKKIFSFCRQIQQIEMISEYSDNVFFSLSEVQWSYIWNKSLFFPIFIPGMIWWHSFGVWHKKP